VVLRPKLGHGLLILEVSRSHTMMQHSRYDSSGRVISSSQRPLPDNTQHSQQTVIHESVKVVSLMNRPPYLAGNTPGTHFCHRLCQLQCHSAAGRIMSMKNSNDIIGNRTRSLRACSTVCWSLEWRVINKFGHYTPEN